MSDLNTYDPEDLELLLQNKSFSELLPEEKAFVLQYVDNDLEYDNMRATLLRLEELPQLEPAIKPKHETKAALLEAFAAAHGSDSIAEEDNNPSRIAAWWAWFWDTNKSIFQRPAFQLASVAVLAMLVTYVATFNPEQAQVAEVKEKAKQEAVKKEDKKQVSVSEEKITEEKKFEAKDSDVIEEPIITDPIEDQEIPAPEPIIEELAEEELVNLEVKDKEAEMEFDLVEEVPATAKNDAVYFDADESEEIETLYAPEVILQDDYTTDYTSTDIRSTTGNSMEVSEFNFQTDDSDLKKSLTGKTAETSPATKASAFSHLLAQLHTAE